MGLISFLGGLSEALLEHSSSFFFSGFPFLGESRCDGGSVAVSAQQKQAICSLLNETEVIV